MTVDLGLSKNGTPLQETEISKEEIFITFKYCQTLRTHNWTTSYHGYTRFFTTNTLEDTKISTSYYQGTVSIYKKSATLATVFFMFLKLKELLAKQYHNKVKNIIFYD